MNASGERQDRAFMDRALAEARLGAERGEVPVGALLVAPDGTAFADHNRTREVSDPTAHAEIRVIRAAAEKLGDWRLLDHTLYVTLEPCAMCAGAVVLARIPRLVFAAADPKAGMCGSLANLVQDSRLNHFVELETGVGADEASRMLREFFAARRGGPGTASVTSDGAP
ncbi:MAG: tRNA adenosine(34) deaminase TadA [marine benthic group bacterium]|nr:tRNA adenosine(34) deaminase TadA [Gemmatimonadota bacterium]